MCRRSAFHVENIGSERLTHILAKGCVVDKRLAGNAVAPDHNFWLMPKAFVLRGTVVQDDRTGRTSCYGQQLRVHRKPGALFRLMSTHRDLRWLRKHHAEMGQGLFSVAR